MSDKNASLWRRNLAAMVGASTAVAVTVVGCSSDGETSADATSPSSSTASSALASSPAAEPAPPQSPATASPGAQAQKKQAPGNQAQAGGGQGGELTRDQATEQFTQSVAADEAHWEGDELIASMAWGEADAAGMDTICRGADMLLEQWGTVTLNFPDGSSRDCAG